jgi:4-hydroxy-tetrahydrodipicolinate synthase
VHRGGQGSGSVVAGAGSNNTEEAVGLVQYAEQAGADAALVVTPYYNKPTQRSALRAFRRGRQGDQPADHHLQHSAALGDRHDAGDDGPAGARLQEHHWRQGRHRQGRAGFEQRASCGKDFIQLSGEDASALASTRMAASAASR